MRVTLSIFGCSRSIPLLMSAIGALHTPLPAAHYLTSWLRWTRLKETPKTISNKDCHYYTTQDYSILKPSKLVDDFLTNKSVHFISYL